MRLVQATDEGVIELAFMWLPVFIGMNSVKLQALEQTLKERLREKLIGQPLTEELLDEAHDVVLDVLCEEYKSIGGLRDYLDGIKYLHPES